MSDPLTPAERDAFERLFRADYDSRERREVCRAALERLVAACSEPLVLAPGEPQPDAPTDTLQEAGGTLNRKERREAMRASLHHRASSRRDPWLDMVKRLLRSALGQPRLYKSAEERAVEKR